MIELDQNHRGIHNGNLDATRKRIEKSKQYQDLSTIIITPCYDAIHWRVVQNWMGILKPMNQKCIHLFASNMEVGAAYSETIEMILQHPELSTFRFVATLEHDNLVDPDLLLKIYPDMEEYDAIGSLYFTKGEGGLPMCYGKPDVMPVNFIPFMPEQNAVTTCRGLGMGATVFKMSMLKDKRLPRPLFKTVQEYNAGQGSACFTQDLKFFHDAGMLGYKFGCTTKTLTGHFDSNTNIVW